MPWSWMLSMDSSLGVSKSSDSMPNRMWSGIKGQKEVMGE